MIKSRFRSRSEHSLDAKGRLNFPSRFREVLQQYDSEILMIAPWGNKHLRLFPLAEWELLETKLLTEGRKQPRIAKLRRHVVGGVAECSIDKQNRILLPQYLRQQVNLKKDVMLIGMLDYVEIWDWEAWRHEDQTTSENFDDFDDQLASLEIG